MDDVINKTRSQRILNNIIQVGGATHCQQWDPQGNENRPETGETHILRAGQMKDWHLLVSSKRRGSHSSVDLGTTDETGKGVHGESKATTGRPKGPKQLTIRTLRNSQWGFLPERESPDWGDTAGSTAQDDQGRAPGHEREKMFKY